MLSNLYSYEKEYEVEGYKEDYDGCICYSCKCRKCIWYEYLYNDGYCRLSWMGVVELTIDWNRNYIEVKIKHAKNYRFEKIIDILKKYKFVFIKDEKIWLKPIEEDTVHQIKKELWDVTFVKCREVGKPPKTIKQSKLGIFGD